jgi:predicted neutral ceramidase superfamily lipid hydrolase
MFTFIRIPRILSFRRMSFAVTEFILSAAVPPSFKILVTDNIVSALCLFSGVSVILRRAAHISCALLDRKWQKGSGSYSTNPTY